MLIVPIVQAALAEDVPFGDVTSDALIPAGAGARARIVTREEGVLSGIEVAARVFATLTAAVDFRACFFDGSRIADGAVIAELEGPARELLAGERTALNFLQRMSGIATTTRRYVEAIRGTRARIVDTRKTAPGLRLLDKYAVRCGGGSNHRYSLSDGVLVKDNHLEVLAEEGRDWVTTLKERRAAFPHTLQVEIEVDRLDQIEPALEAGADIILLDNMSGETLREAVRAIDGRALTEASGGVNLQTVREIAEAGVDLISVGALTHSVKALDISLDMQLL